MMASELAPGQAKSGKELYLMYDKIHYKKKKKKELYLGNKKVTTMEGTFVC